MDHVHAADQHAALAARYGADAVPPLGPWDETIALMLRHRSVRAFRPDPLPAHTLETLVAAAQSAPTSSNLQTWSVVAVHDPATRAAMAQLAGQQQHIESCPLFLVFLADLSRLERLGNANARDLEGLPYLESFLVAAIDAALAAQNAVTAAEAVGLHSVYIGALRNDPLQVARLLGLPPGVMGVFGLCVGYADPSAPGGVKPRLPQAAILHHDRYVVPDEAAIFTAYDAKLGAFSTTYELKAYSWTQRVLGRIGKLKALAGRDALQSILHKMGFPLR